MIAILNSERLKNSLKFFVELFLLINFIALVIDFVSSTSFLVINALSLWNGILSCLFLSKRFINKNFSPLFVVSMLNSWVCIPNFLAIFKASNSTPYSENKSSVIALNLAMQRSLFLFKIWVLGFLPLRPETKAWNCSNSAVVSELVFIELKISITLSIFSIVGIFILLKFWTYSPFLSSLKRIEH